MKVWVTRDEAPDGPLCTALRAAGLEPQLEPVVGREAVSDAAEDLARLGPDDWLVLTSVLAVESVASDAARVLQVAVVGEVSRRAAEARGFRVALVGSGNARSLWAQLHRHVHRGRVCYPRSSLAEPPEPWDDVEIISPVLYQTAPREFDRSLVERVDVVALASPSAVDALRAAGVDLRVRPCATIGPTTSAALRAVGVPPAIEAAEQNFAALAAAIAGTAPDKPRV